MAMFPRKMFRPDGFANVVRDGEVVGFKFDMRIQYYRGIQLSIMRGIDVAVDSIEYPREAIRFTVNDETFTQDEMLTVVHNRWHFGQWATVTVLIPGGLSAGLHHIDCMQHIAPSYMPAPLAHGGSFDFEIA